MSDALFAYVINAAWQATVIGASGLVFSRGLTARSRFIVLALTLLACVLAPALTFAPRSAPAVFVAAVEPNDTSLVAVVYLIGLALIALRMLLGALRAYRIVQASARLRGCVRVSALIDGPVTIGRTVVLPQHVANDRALRAAAIAHEHAHVRRHDYAMHLGLELAALPLYFHPLICVLRRALAEAREMACDEAAALRRGERVYAKALVTIASMCRAKVAIAMAGTAIERRVDALLHPRARNDRRARLVIPLLIAAACTRFNAAPAAIGGHWSLIREASTVHYDRFTQVIEQDPTRVSVRQERTLRGRTRRVTWSVITDGVKRPLAGARGAEGSAEWKDGKLHLRMTGPGAHHETGVAFIRGGRLICDVVTERGRIHSEFERVKP